MHHKWVHWYISLKIWRSTTGIDNGSIWAASLHSTHCNFRPRRLYSGQFCLNRSYLDAQRSGRKRPQRGAVRPARGSERAFAWRRRVALRGDVNVTQTPSPRWDADPRRDAEGLGDARLRPRRQRRMGSNRQPRDVGRRGVLVGVGNCRCVPFRRLCRAPVLGSRVGEYMYEYWELKLYA
jgi:hypothetical protein